MYKMAGNSQVEVYGKVREICHLVFLKGLHLKYFEQMHFTAESYHLLGYHLVIYL